MHIALSKYALLTLIVNTYCLHVCGCRSECTRAKQMAEKLQQRQQNSANFSRMKTFEERQSATIP